MQKKPRKFHGGDIYRHPDVIDFSVNTNPLGTPESVKRAVQESVAKIEHYPDVRCEALRKAISRFEQVNMEEILCGNGAAELFFAAVQAVCPQKALVIAPSFSEYEEALRSVGAEAEYYYLCEEDNFQIQEDYVDKLSEEIDMIFLCNPNNPTGQTIDRDMLIKILDRCKKQNIVVILDECFLEFLDEPNRYEMSNLRGEYPNLLIIKAFTKIFSMPGLRLGYAISSNPDILEEMSWKLQQWNVSVPAQMAGVAALENPKEYIRQTREYVSGQREYMRNIMKMMGYVVFASKANYLFFKGRPGLEKEALEAGFLIRDCQNYEGLSEGFYRIAVRTKEENERLITWLGRL
ncbi:aminotransferase class I/II-fold pyridoxal phosphate-dependent enzyme [Dorea formicigenerans]|uniref:pyridoxal phosphate-dependent aminotransferase n=1 Tax=Dorea formicigenerans TaxID=39486 RepID=UPI0015702C40|nr:aminotransferase class I/II-fold pyridoxal phosphate-dependent enzyme [Dorea formicigenerans]